MGQCLASADKNKDGKLDAKEVADLVIHTLDKAGVLIKQAQEVTAAASAALEPKEI